MQNAYSVQFGTIDEVMKQRDDLMAQVSGLRADLTAVSEISEKAGMLEVVCLFAF